MADGFLQVKRPNQQYQSTEGESCKGKQPQKTQRKHKLHVCIHTQNSIQIKQTRINTASPLVYNNMGCNNNITTLCLKKGPNFETV